MDIRTIVVGVDGSPASDTALDWAAAEAVRRAVPLEVLHTASSRITVPAGAPPEAYDEAADEDVLDAAAARARAAFPGISVITRSEHRDPASALIERSTGAELVVVGAHGKGLLARVLLGSVSHRVVAHARCPAVVVHRTAGTPGLPVAVGVDGSAGAAAALALAVEEAELRRVPLLVVHGWQAAPGSGFDALPVPQEVVDAQHSAALDVVEDAVARAREQSPNLEVSYALSPVGPVQALDAESVGAQLLVVGAHGHRGLSGLAFGSVTSGVVDGAQCPVMVAQPAA
ncbi:MAG: universal stress protein [Candidatus Nanopelagicales bacterium]